MSTADRYYKVGPAFWTDHAAWTDDERLLGLYVLTCPHRSTEGLFRLPVAYMAADLRWQEKRVRRALATLVAHDFIAYDDQAGVVLIVKALKWQQPSNPNGVKAAVKALRAVPPTVLATRFRGLAERFAERLAEGLPEGIPAGLGDPPSSTLAPSVSVSGRDAAREHEDTHTTIERKAA